MESSEDISRETRIRFWYIALAMDLAVGVREIKTLALDEPDLNWRQIGEI